MKAIEIDRLRKEYGAVIALNDVTFSIDQGSIHALIGENGAGKSTLIKILAGAVQPDGGTLRILERDYNPQSPGDAMAFGIHVMHQEPQIAPDLPVWANIFLHRELQSSRGTLDVKQMKRQAREAITRFGVSIDVDQLGYSLSFAEKQIVELCRIYLNESRIVILDEPTAALNAQETEQLLGFCRQLNEHGTTIIFVSHRLPEVLSISHAVTVLKDGGFVGTFATGDNVDEDFLVRQMVGRSIVREQRPVSVRSDDNAILTVTNWGGPGDPFHDIHLNIHRGEIVAIAGLEGSGHHELARSLFGLLPAHQGQVTMNGRPLGKLNPRRAMRNGIAYLSSDRRRESALGPLSVKINMSIAAIPQFSKGGVIQSAKETSAVQSFINRFGIKTPDMNTPIERLSGGNQQKVIVARWLAQSPDVIIFDEPTQGIDIGSKSEIHTLMQSLADAGKAIIVVSSDLIEVLTVSDRIVIMADGQIVGNVATATATEESVIGAIASHHKTAESEPTVADSASTGSGEGLQDTVAAKRGKRKWSLNEQQAMVLPVLLFVVLVAIWGISESPYFLGALNLQSLFSSAIPIFLVSLGQMLVLLLGGVDLSVGSVVSLVTVVASFIMPGQGAGHIVEAIAAALAIGIGVGLLNGFLIVKLGIPDLIATLATMTGVGGIALSMRSSPGGTISPGFMTAMSTNAGPFPLMLVLVIVWAVAIYIAMSKTPFGNRYVATGSNRTTAWNQGINPRSMRVYGYVFCGLSAAVAGLFFAAMIGTGDPTAGNQYSLMSITAAVVGGSSLFGGRWSLSGTLLGALLLALVTNVLDLLQVSAYYTYVLTGGLTIVAVVLYSLYNKRRRGLDVVSA